MNNLEQQIRAKLVAYLRKDLSLSKLHGWLAPILWNIESQSGDDSAELANEIALLLDEYGYGHWTEGELRGEFVKLLALNTEGLVGIWHPYVLIAINTATSSASDACHPRSTSSSWWSPQRSGQSARQSEFSYSEWPAAFELSAAY